jgi:two-component system LytT family response regulator
MPRSVPDVLAPPVQPRVLIVDDEPLARDCIRLALEQSGHVEIAGECADGESAVAAIGETSPDLVFLDVQMPELDGFGVIERVGVESMPPIVFVTAYDEHALHAFEVHALDYVLKPFDDARLLAAYDHARLVMLERRRGELVRKLTSLLDDWRGHDAPAGFMASPHHDADVSAVAVGAAGAAYVTRFTVRRDGRVSFVPAAAVEWIGADGNYVVLHAGEAAHRMRGSLRDVGARLDPRIFVRVHRTAIVNVERIRELQPWFGGDYVAILRSGAKLKVSRRRVSQLLKPMA